MRSALCSRISFRFLLTCITFLGLIGPARAEDKVLRIIGWEGYMDESFTKAFTEKTGYKVVATYAGSSDEMYAKIKAGGGTTYDMVTASGDLTKRLYDSGLLEKVDLKKVPNYEKLFPLFKKPPYNTFDGAPYGVSIAWGPDFLIYDTSVVKTPPTSWNVLYDPAYKDKISLNDYAIIIADVALWLGKPDIYKLSSKDLAEIKPKLMALKPQVRKFWTSQGELTQLFLNHEIVMAWAWPVTITQLKKEGFPVGAVIPKEGATGWSDSWMIIKGSPNAEAAHAWMNYMLEGEPQKKMAGVSGYWPVSSLITPLLSAEEQKDMHINDLDQYYGKIHFWETVQNYDEWTALWNEFRGQ